MMEEESDGMEAPADSSSSSSAIDMSKVSLALELVKTDRVGSASSLNSWTGTVLITPDECRSASSSSSSSSSVCSGVCSGGDSGGRGDGSDEPRRKACVRWSDEDGGDLVTEVRVAQDFWEEMVFGPQEAGGADSACSPATEQPSELCMFITELTRGVEATVVFKGLTKKRRKVVLFTDDNGESLSWLVSGSAKQPYRIRCETLLEVKAKRRRGAACANGGAEDDECCDISLKWLPQPTWPKRRAKLVDIATESHAVFASGMRQLLSFNQDLQQGC